MFGLGLWEIGVVVLLAVMLFPPKELPKLARSIARTYGQIRRTAEQFRNQIMEDEDLRAPIDEVRSAYNDARWELKKAEAAARRELAKAEMEARKAAALAKEEEDKKAAIEGEANEGAEGSDAKPPAIAAADDYDKAHLDPFKDEAAPEAGSPLDAFRDDGGDDAPKSDRVPAKPPRAFVPPPPALAKDDDDDAQVEAPASDKAESSVA